MRWLSLGLLVFVLSSCFVSAGMRSSTQTEFYVGDSSDFVASEDRGNFGEEQSKMFWSVPVVIIILLVILGSLFHRRRRRKVASKTRKSVKRSVRKKTTSKAKTSRRKRK